MKEINSMPETEEQQLQSQTSRRNIEQKRGQQAWKNVSDVKAKAKKDEKLEQEYRSLARGLNAMIQINGLGQTLGFLKAKSKGKNDEKKAHYFLLEHLTQWMQCHFTVANKDVLKDGYDGLLKWVIDEQTSSADYRRATTECMAFGMWLRRFAEGELKAPKQGEQ
jgi:CRISPR-associated protein Cmr5